MGYGRMVSGDVFFNGKSTKLPTDVARKISIRASEIIKQTAPRGPNNSRMRVKPTSQMGQVGVYFPPDARHLIYLDRGIKPRLMTELTGKTVPIRLPNGAMIFRKATNVGSNILSRNENGHFNSYRIAWSYPGVAAMNFIQPAIKQALDEWYNELNNQDLVYLLNNTDNSELKKFMRRLSVSAA